MLLMVLLKIKKEYEYYNNNKNLNEIDNQMFEDLDLKAILEASLNETINELTSKLPQEPSENDPNAITLAFNYNQKSETKVFSRRFSLSNKIQV